MPSGFTFNATTRTISGTPTASGTWTVTITATAGGESLSESFDLTVKNVKPAGSTPDQVLTAGSAFNYTLPAYSDANGDTLTYSATISPSGSGITFNPATRKFAGTPPTGTYNITVTVNDGHGGVLVDVFVLAVGAPGVAPKVGTGLVDQSTMTGQTFQYVFLNRPEFYRHIQEPRCA